MKKTTQSGLKAYTRADSEALVEAARAAGVKPWSLGLVTEEHRKNVGIGTKAAWARRLAAREELMRSLEAKKADSKKEVANQSK